MSEGHSRTRRNTTGVGGVVVRQDEILVVRMTYGPSQGHYMLPGGLLDPGETLDDAIRREVHEEASIIAEPHGIIGVRSRYTERGTDTYLVWLLRHISGDPVPDGRENDDARFMTLDEMAEREDVVYLVKYMASRVLNGGTTLFEHMDDYTYRSPGATQDNWKLFM
jgi:8-oxo-dGTP diphosphatase